MRTSFSYACQTRFDFASLCSACLRQESLIHLVKQNFFTLKKIPKKPSSGPGDMNQNHLAMEYKLFSSQCQGLMATGLMATGLMGLHLRV
jgi:hypothetical protein